MGLNDQLKVLSAEQRNDLAGFCSRGLARLGLKKDATPAQIAEAADELIEAEQIEREKYFKGLWLMNSRPAKPIIEEISILWGEQIVRQMKWSWKFVDREENPDFAIVEPKQKAIIFPRVFLKRVLGPPYVDNTLMLTFNMLKEGGVQSADGDLNDLTGRASFIIPKRNRPWYR